MGYVEIFIEIESNKKSIKKLYDKIQKANGEFCDMDFFSAVKPKMNLDTKYEWASGSFGETLKSNQLYAWIGGSRCFIRNNFKGIEVSPAIDKYVRLDDDGYLIKGSWENVFLKHYSIEKGIILNLAICKDCNKHTVVFKKYSCH